MTVTRKEAAAGARGEQPFDLAILNVQLVNVFTAEIYAADIGIVGERFAYVERAWS